MSNRNRNGPKLDLKLHLSPPRMNWRVESTSRSATVSPQSSSVSSELNQDSPEAKSMLLVGCPNCLIYVMLSEEDPRCPKCKSGVLLDISSTFVWNSDCTAADHLPYQLLILSS